MSVCVRVSVHKTYLFFPDDRATLSMCYSSYDGMHDHCQVRFSKNMAISRACSV